MTSLVSPSSMTVPWSIQMVRVQRFSIAAMLCDTKTTVRPPSLNSRIDLEIDFLNLMPGTYYAGIDAATMHEYQDSLDNVVKIDVEPSDYYGTGRGIEGRLGLV